MLNIYFHFSGLCTWDGNYSHVVKSYVWVSEELPACFLKWLYILHSLQHRLDIYASDPTHSPALTVCVTDCNPSRQGSLRFWFAFSSAWWCLTSFHVLGPRVFKIQPFLSRSCVRPKRKMKSNV
jgi:hypothetical protein